MCDRAAQRTVLGPLRNHTPESTCPQPATAFSSSSSCWERMAGPHSELPQAGQSRWRAVDKGGARDAGSTAGRIVQRKAQPLRLSLSRRRPLSGRALPRRD
eukprot:256938-Rhodomonas_salina.1